MRAGTGKYPDAVPSRLGSLPLLRDVKRRPAVVRAFGIVHRARMVEQPLRFALREWRRAPQPARYRPRGAAADVFLRDGTSDLDILDEVFGRGLYRLADPVRAADRGRPPRVLDLGGHNGLFGAWGLGELGPRSSPRSRPTRPTPRCCGGPPRPAPPPSAGGCSRGGRGM